MSTKDPLFSRDDFQVYLTCRLQSTCAYEIVTLGAQLARELLRLSVR